MKRPGLLLIDDATSAVDPRVEAEILAGLRSLGAAGRAATVLIVAHRLSTIRMADRVVFLDGGRVAATGPTKISSTGGYAELARAYEQAEEREIRTATSAARSRSYVSHRRERGRPLRRSPACFGGRLRRARRCGAAWRSRWSMADHGRRRPDHRARFCCSR